jgi:hypothetical protein
MDLAHKGITFTKKEIVHILFAIFSFALIFFIQKWRTTDFTIATGLPFFIFLFLFFIIFTFYITAVQKWFGWSKGYRVEYETSGLFILIGMLISFLFQGYVLVLVPGFMLLHLTSTRVGHFRMEINDRDVGGVALMGVIACIVAFLFFLIVYAITKSYLFSDLMKIVMAFAVAMLIPAFKNHGLALVKWSRTLFAIAFVVTFLIFLAASLSDPSLVIGILIGGGVLFAMGVIDLLPRLFYGA